MRALSKADLDEEVSFVDVIAVGTGGGRHAYARMLGEGFDAMLAHIVVYGVAEGFSRAAGHPEGDPSRFHDGEGRDAGADLPEGLDSDSLSDRAREAMRDERLFAGLLVDQIEGVAMTVGADLYLDKVPAPCGP